MIDTHTHFYADEFDADRNICVENAINKGVSHFFLPAIDSSTHQKMFSIEAQFPNKFFAMMGLHPCYVKEESYLEELDIVKTYLEERDFCAIGEIGLDLHWDKTTLDIQILAFETQIDWAIEIDKPIIIHARESLYKILEILKAKKQPKLRGILHCFSGSLEEARQAISLGFLLGIGGVLTYKNSNLAKYLQEIPLESIVLETDAPYLSPVPYRGKRNESAYLEEIVNKLVDIYKIPSNEIDKITTENAKKIFGLI